MKYIYFLIALLVSISCFSQKQFSITGNINDLPDGTVLTLFKSEGSVGIRVGTDTVRNGRFSFSGIVPPDTTEKFMLSAYGNEGFPPMNVELFIKENSAINVTGRGKLLKTWKVKSPVNEQKQWNLFVQTNKKLWDEEQRLYVKRKELFTGIDKLEKKESEERKKQIDSIDRLIDPIEYLLKTKDVQIFARTQVSPVSMDFLKWAAMRVKNNPDSLLRSEVTKSFNTLSPDQKKSALGEEINILLNPPPIVAVGEQMADAEMVDTSGNRHMLVDHSGKFLLLDFWSFGCGPCHMAIPEMKEIFEANRDSLMIVSVTLDTRSAWLQASNKFAMPWLNLSDGKQNRGLAARYGVSSIPHYALISPQGKLLSSWIGYGEGMLKQKIKEFVVTK